MELYDLVMPPFLRMQWRSKEVRDKYLHSFNLARIFFRSLELESVIHGLRHATTDHVAPEDFDKKQQMYIKKGLVFLPIQKVGEYSGFSTYHPAVEEGKPWNYYGVVADSIQHAQEFAHASDVGDQKVMGNLLGYPVCCTQFFEDVWLKGYTDPIWQQANASSKEKIRHVESNRIRLKDVPWESNSLLKSHSIGPVFHVKCSIDCPHTLQCCREWIALGQHLKIPGMREMEMFLRMPMEWDCTKGIVYIKTPLFKISTNSMSIVQRYRVQVEGTYFPHEGSSGLDFPWTEEFVTVARNGNQLTL